MPSASISNITLILNLTNFLRPIREFISGAGRKLLDKIRAGVLTVVYGRPTIKPRPGETTCYLMIIYCKTSDTEPVRFDDSINLS